MKQTIGQAAAEYQPINGWSSDHRDSDIQRAFMKGGEWQAEQDKELAIEFAEWWHCHKDEYVDSLTMGQLFDQFIKSKQ